MSFKPHSSLEEIVNWMASTGCISQKTPFHLAHSPKREPPWLASIGTLEGEGYDPTEAVVELALQVQFDIQEEVGIATDRIAKLQKCLSDLPADLKKHAPYRRGKMRETPTAASLSATDE